MLTETLLSFDQWQNWVLQEGTELPEDVTLQNRLYEAYATNFHSQPTPEILNESNG